YRRFLRCFFILIVIFNTIIIYGQTVRGILVQENTSTALPNVSVFVAGGEISSVTDPAGGFELFPVPVGIHQLQGIVNGDTIDISTITVDQEIVNLGEVAVKTSGGIPILGELAIIDFSEISGFESENDNFSGLLSASQDPISNAAAFNLS